MRKFALAVLTLSIPCAIAQADDWPQWRGPHGNGVSPETGLPSTWSKGENIAWRARLGGQGISSPIAYGDLIIVTSQEGRGDVRPGNHPTLGQGGDFPEEQSMSGAPGQGVVFLVEAYHRSDGKRSFPKSTSRRTCRIRVRPPTVNASMPGSAPVRWWPSI